MSDPFAAVSMRVSTKDQGEYHGLKAQIDACRDCANRVGLIIVAEYEDRMLGQAIDHPGV